MRDCWRLLLMSLLASLTAVCRRSSDNTEKRRELLQLSPSVCSVARGTNFSITIGAGGPTRVSRLEGCSGMASLNSN